MTNRLFTTREFANFYKQEGINVAGNPLTYFELPRSAIEGEMYGSINSICNNYISGSSGATKEQYQSLWSASDFNPLILNSTYYASSNLIALTDIPILNMHYRINMKNTTSFTMTLPKNTSDIFDVDDGVLCVK